MTSIHTFGRLIELKFRVRFVNCIISQMHEEVPKIFLLGDTVGYIKDQIRSVANLAKPYL